jgi:hypothetical protein
MPPIDCEMVSHLPLERIDILRRARKGALDGLAFGKTPAALEQGPSFGALWLAKTLCRRLGITPALGNNRHTPFVLFMIAARLLEPGSKLYSLPKVFSAPPSPSPPVGGRGNKRKELLANAIAAMRWSKTHAVKEIFGLEPESFDENSFYRALSLLATKQTNIELNLFRRSYSKKSPSQRFLYDVTSSMAINADIRYVLRRNPERMRQIKANRHDCSRKI